MSGFTGYMQNVRDGNILATRAQADSADAERRLMIACAKVTMTSVVMGTHSSNAARSPRMLRGTRVQQKRNRGAPVWAVQLMVRVPSRVLSWLHGETESRHSKHRVAGGGCSIWRDRAEGNEVVLRGALQKGHDA
jgi:hypothetical protein